MSQKDVVRRPTTSSRRKTPDGNRSDSGCFDDVDVVQMATLQNHCVNKTPEQFEGTVQESHTRTESDALGDAQETQVKAEESVDDTEFRNILERLAEVTKNPGDMYRLCFSSRLSFAGLSLGGADDDTFSCQQTSELATGTKANEVDSLSEETTTTVTSGVGERERLKEAGHKHKDCGNRQKCVELLSMLSSFVEKANENPTVFNQSGLGKSLLGQFSSLLCTLEEAKSDASASSRHNEAGRSTYNIQRTFRIFAYY